MPLSTEPGPGLSRFLGISWDRIPVAAGIAGRGDGRAEVLGCAIRDLGPTVRARLTRGLRIGPWWCSFLVFAALALAWSVTTPPFAEGDEASQIVYASAVGSGHVLPEVEGEYLGGAGVDTRQNLAEFEVPTEYTSEWECFIGRPAVPPSCAGELQAHERTEDLATYHGRYPPLYYGLVGWPASLVPSTFGYRLMRVVSALLAAAFFASAIQSALQGRRSRLLVLGVIVGATPGVFFQAGGVHSSGFEIVAALCLWTTLLALVAEPEGIVDEQRRRRLVRVAVISGVALVLARPLSPLWAVLIVLTVIALSDRGTLRALARMRSTWVASGIVVCAAAIAGAWYVIRDPGLNLIRFAPDAPTPGTLATIRTTLGRVGPNQLRDMIGHFGWPGEVSAPTLTIICWGGALIWLGVMAFIVTARRERLVLGTLAALVVVIPLVIVGIGADTYVAGWVGRYQLPLALGVPLVSAFLLDRHATRAGSIALKGATFVVAATAVGHIAAYATVAHRYIVGTSGPIFYLFDAVWQPALPPVLLALVIVIGCTLLAWWTRRAISGASPLVDGIRLTRSDLASAFLPRRSVATASVEGAQDLSSGSGSR